jgi:hypothetical protein
MPPSRTARIDLYSTWATSCPDPNTYRVLLGGDRLFPIDHFGLPSNLSTDQKGPIANSKGTTEGQKGGQYHTPKKEHIANEEHIVYTPEIAIHWA